MRHRPIIWMSIFEYCSDVRSDGIARIEPPEPLLGLGGFLRIGKQSGPA